MPHTQTAAITETVEPVDFDQNAKAKAVVSIDLELNPATFQALVARVIALGTDLNVYCETAIANRLCDEATTAEAPPAPTTRTKILAFVNWLCTSLGMA